MGFRHRSVSDTQAAVSRHSESPLFLTDELSISLNMLKRDILALVDVC